jgi:hypothetical protein
MSVAACSCTPDLARPAPPRRRAGQVQQRPVVRRETNDTPGFASASAVTTSLTARVSALTDFRNLARAGAL